MEDEKQYKITIEEMGVHTVTRGKDWREGAGPNKQAGEFGYTPEIEKQENYSRMIYQQTVGSLYIDNIIKAINGL